MNNSVEFEQQLAYCYREEKELGADAFRNAKVLGTIATRSEIINHLTSNNGIICEPYADRLHTAIKMEEFPGKIIDESRSAHAVGMGRIIKPRPNKKSGVGNAMSVAIKPFNDPIKAANEVWGYWQLQDLGIETFDPVGIFPDSNRLDVLVLTKKRNDFTSLDRDEWIVGGAIKNNQEAKQHQKNLEAVTDIARIMAKMHMNGLFHPDGQIKNFAVTNTGVVGVIDTENLFKIDVAQHDPSAYVINDIEKLMRSLVEKPITQSIHSDQDKLYSVGLFYGNDSKMLRGKYNDLFLQPYIEQIDAEVTQQPHLQNAAEQLFYGLLEHYERSEREDWPKCLASGT